MSKCFHPYTITTFGRLDWGTDEKVKQIRKECSTCKKVFATMTQENIAGMWVTTKCFKQRRQ